MTWMWIWAACFLHKRNVGWILIQMKSQGQGRGAVDLGVLLLFELLPGFLKIFLEFLLALFPGFLFLKIIQDSLLDTFRESASLHGLVMKKKDSTEIFDLSVCHYCITNSCQEFRSSTPRKNQNINT